MFNKNLENQRLAFNAARKAFDLTSNQAGGYAGGYSGGYSGGHPGNYYPNPNIASRFPAFPSLPGFTMPSPITNFGNSAFASAAAGPGYQHQVASIYPGNPVSLFIYLSVRKSCTCLLCMFLMIRSRILPLVPTCKS